MGLASLWLCPHDSRGLVLWLPCVRACRSKMSPSLDIYSFGLVVLFLFAEKVWWDRSERRSANLKARGRLISAMLTELEGMAGLYGIAREVRRMLDRDPRRRPSAAECVFDADSHDV